MYPLEGAVLLPGAAVHGDDDAEGEELDHRYYRGPLQNDRCLNLTGSDEEADLHESQLATQYQDEAGELEVDLRLS